MAPSRKLPVVLAAVILVVGGLSTIQSVVVGQDYEAVKQRLLKAVEQDGLSFEQAAAMMRALKQVGNDRVDRRRAPNADGRVRLDGMVLRVKQAIEEGRITEEEGKERLAEARKRMQQDKDDRSRDRDRDAGNRGQRDRDDARGRDSDSKDDRPRDRRRDAGNRVPPSRDGVRGRDSDFNKDDRPRDRRRDALDNSQQQRGDARRRVAAAEKQIKEMIKEGQMSKEDGQARMERLRERVQRMERDDRGEGDRRREMDRRDNDRREMDRREMDRREPNRRRDVEPDRDSDRTAERRPGNAEKEILRMVDDGKLTKEEGRARIKGLREREFRNDPQRREQQRNTGARQRIAEAEKKLKELIESGRISEEDAKERIKELRQRLERMQGDDARRGARDRAPQRGESDRARRGQPDRPQRGPSDRDAERGGKDSFNPRSRGEQMGRRLNESARPFETYRKVQAELMDRVKAGDMTRSDANKKLEALKEKLWSEDSDSRTEGRREGSRESDRRRRGDRDSDLFLTDREVETIQKVVEAAVRDGVRKGTESDR